VYIIDPLWSSLLLVLPHDLIFDTESTAFGTLAGFVSVSADVVCDISSMQYDITHINFQPYTNTITHSVVW